MAVSLTTGRPWRVILAFAVPLLIGNVVQQLYQFADAIVVGRHLGVDALAAVGATGSLLFLLIGFAWGLTQRLRDPDRAGLRRGRPRRGAPLRRDRARCSPAATSVVHHDRARPLARRARCSRCCRPRPSSCPRRPCSRRSASSAAATIMFFNYLSAVIRAIGDSRTPLVFLTVSCALNVGARDPHGRPVSTGASRARRWRPSSRRPSRSRCASCTCWRRLPVLHVHRADWRVTRADLAEHLRLGLPMGFQASIIAIGTLTVQVALNALGADAVAAYTTASRVDGLAIAFLAVARPRGLDVRGAEPRRAPPRPDPPRCHRRRSGWP